MTLPFALSVHNFVNSVGAYVGFGSIVAVAILILLYFAHARETATLRERLDEAQQRIGALEGRIAQLMQLQGSQRARVPGPVAPVPAPAGLRPATAPVGAVRRVPSPATAAAVATAPAAAGMAAAAAPGRGVVSVPAAPAGTGAPSLASATKLIPDAAAVGSPDDTMYVPAAVAANGKSAAERTAVLAAPRQATAAAAASARPAGASPRGAVTPPRMQIGAEAGSAAATATAAGGATKVRRIAGNPKSTVSLPPFDEEFATAGRFAGRVLPLLIGAIAIAVIIAGLIVITSNGGSPTSGNVAHNNPAQTGQSLHKKQTTPVPFNAANVTVAVLNGTAQSGLAGDVGKKLAGDGYRKGNITNAASQTQGLTSVYYVARGRATKANLVAAQHVARALTLPASRVHRASDTVLQSCTISATGAALGSCTANVIVSVGQDRVSLATG